MDTTACLKTAYRRITHETDEKVDELIDGTDGWLERGQSEAEILQ